MKIKRQNNNIKSLFTKRNNVRKRLVNKLFILLFCLFIFIYIYIYIFPRIQRLHGN